MEKVRCEVCKEYFKTELKCRTCDECRFKISQMPREIPYKDRRKKLKEQYESERSKKELTLHDRLLLFYCKKCLWCRKVDVAERKIYCALPECGRFSEVKNEEA